MSEPLGVVAKYASGRGKRSTKAELCRERATASVISLWASGATIEETCEKTGLSWTTVYRIRTELDPEFVQLFNKAKTNEVAQLIEEGLKQSLKATINIVNVTEDEAWLKAQRAPELATLYGVVSDKTVRILAAIERANERESQNLPNPRENSQEKF